ncbi:MAG TPA: TIGR04282 family arsenosugar biosynthesis glycosyltransferase [Candidatus Eisenbacteria bacterium]|nr:TIGR04282 family arsenosugar biosynthesis glycosyltransferase [Candidatus Eisenbacteria bacterium]
MTNPRTLAKPAIGLFAKAPIPGRVKTRLCPPLDATSAARLYAAFLSDIAATLDANEIWEWFAMSPEPDALRDHWPAGAPLPRTFLPQIGKDLGERMAHALALLLEEHPSAILVGSDHPTLSAHLLTHAVRALEEADLVLGPTRDGGLYAIGSKGPVFDLLRGIEWSTKAVFETVAARVRDLRLRTVCLPPWYDVDDAGDLAFLREHVALLETQCVSPCPRTRAALKDLGF